jgi:hypothetical protein
MIDPGGGHSDANALPQMALVQWPRRLDVNTMIRGVATLILTAALLQMAACRDYVPPKTGIPSRQNWLEGGGG